jgi:uncharacterized protein (TIGR02246 family)
MKGRLFALLAAEILFFTAPAAAALTDADVRALNALQQSYVQGWLDNDREKVMAVMAPDAVFIPHDGVMPHTGAADISEFWFPGGKAIGRVPSYQQRVTAISGDGNHATMYGRFDLHYEASDKHYRWVGNFLIVARKSEGRWLVTHMMASDADPTITPIGSRSDSPQTQSSRR